MAARDSSDKPPGLARRLRLASRELKRRAIRFRQGPRPNVAIFAARRGGSELLSDMLACQPGVWIVSEPFARIEGHPSCPAATRWLPEMPNSQYFGLAPDEERAVHAYVSALNRASAGIGTCRFTKFPLRADRVVLKILNAPFLLDDIVERHGMVAVSLMRHPASQALSVSRQSWQPSVHAYFARPDFLARFLDGEQLEFGRRTLADGDLWDALVLNAVIETLYPLRHARRVAHRLSYEELVVDSEAVVGALCAALRFDHAQRMLDVIERPSGSSKGRSSRETIERIAQGDRLALVSAWQSKLDADQKRRAQRILDGMGYDVYDMGHPLPLAGYRQRADEPATQPTGT